MGTKEVGEVVIRRALVTGGNGFVGRAIVSQLLAEGVEVRVVGRRAYPELTAMGVHCLQGSISDYPFMREAVRGMDVVFHVAALAGVWGAWQRYYETNVLGTEIVVRACRGRVPTLVHTSTPSVVFAGKSIEAGDESLPYPNKFLCHYARSKVMAEQRVLGCDQKELRSCSLRPHLIWGPGDPHLLPRLIETHAKKRLKQVGRGDNLVDISYVDNVAHAHILAAKNLAAMGVAAGKAYFISQGKPVNLWGWLNQVFSALGIAGVKNRISFSKAYAAGALCEGVYKLSGNLNDPPMTRFVAEQLAKSHYFSIESAANDFGYTPIVSTEEGVQRFVSWYRANKK